jgi:hypothetical protein
VTAEADRTRASTGGPIFIGGLERTGTSLLFALLASHRNISMTRRTNWWTFYHDRYGDLADPKNLEKCLTAMRRYRRHAKLEPDIDRLRKELVSGEPSYCRLFALLQQHHAERMGKPRWGDKSLHTERYASTVFRCFPEARIIHMIRDPRDRYASAVKRWHGNRGGVGSATAAWITSVHLGARNTERFPEKYFVLRYETLVQQPEKTLRELCDFIGETYDPGMLNMSGAEEFRETGGNSSFGRFAAGEISTASIGRFRSVLDEPQLAFIQGRAGRLMSDYAYQSTTVRMSGTRQLRYLAVDAPLNFAKMALWQGREMVYNLTGRSPSAHTVLDGR